MIHFDTNALIALPQRDRRGAPMVDRIVDGEAAAVCVIVWYEDLVGPLPQGEADLARSFVRQRIDPVTEKVTALAAELYNQADRSRRFTTDALIAATAMQADAELVTVNVDDFRPFETCGLRLLAAEA